MTEKLNQIENDAGGCARLHEVAFTLTAKQGIPVAAVLLMKPESDRASRFALCCFCRGWEHAISHV